MGEEGWVMRYKKLFTLYRVRNKKGKFIYHFKIWNEEGTKRISHSTGCTSKCKAEAYALAFVLDPVKKAALLQVEPEKSQSDTLFKDYAKYWWDWDRCPYVLARRRRGTEEHPGIKKSYTESARMWKEDYLMRYLGKYRISELTSVKIELMMRKLKSVDKLSPKSINNIRSVLSVMLNEAVKDGILKTNPVNKVLPMIVVKKEKELLTKEEAGNLLNINNFYKYWDGNYKLYSMNLLAALTGMRLGEIRGLRIQDIHENEIHIEHSFGKYGLTTTKTSENRTIPISNEIRAMLITVHSEYSGKSEYVFSGKTGGAIDSSAATTAFKKALKRAGISEEERIRRGLTFHSWRHFFATSCVAANIQSSKIMKATGHKSESMLSHYTSLRTGDSDEIIELQENLGNLFKKN